MRPTSARGRWLVRTWALLVSGAALFVAGTLGYDRMFGEGISHLGWRFMASMGALLVLAVAVLALPLLVAAVVVGRRDDAG